MASLVTFPILAKDLKDIQVHMHGSLCEEISKLGSFDILTSQFMDFISDGCNLTPSFAELACDKDCTASTTTTQCLLENIVGDPFNCAGIVTTLEDFLNALTERILATQSDDVPNWQLNEASDPLDDEITYNGKSFKIIPAGYYDSSTVTKKVSVLNDAIGWLTDGGSDWLRYYLVPEIPGDIEGHEFFNENRLWPIDGDNYIVNFTVTEETYLEDLQAASDWICFLTRLVVYANADGTAETRFGYSNQEFPPATLEEAKEDAVTAFNSNVFGSDGGDWGVTMGIGDADYNSASIYSTRFAATFEFSHLNAAGTAPKIYWKLKLRSYDETSGNHTYPWFTEYAPHGNINQKYYLATVQPSVSDLGTEYDTPVYGEVIAPITTDIFDIAMPPHMTLGKIYEWVVRQPAVWLQDPDYFAVVDRSADPAVGAWNYY